MDFKKVNKFDELYYSVINKDFSKIDKQSFYNMLIEQILNDKSFIPCTKEIFEIIQVEGLDEEFDRYKKTDWLFLKLILPENVSNRIKKFDAEIINMLNEFDIILKERFSMKYIDLIDYDSGEINIVRVK
jgi:hypothetical protein